MTTRGAFHRQGPFAGSGGLYSPGPAVDPPLVATCRPLNDVLTSSWVSAGPSRDALSRRVKADSPTSFSQGTFTDVFTPMTAPR